MAPWLWSWTRCGAAPTRPKARTGRSGWMAQWSARSPADPADRRAGDLRNTGRSSAAGELDRGECLRLLGKSTVGRVVFTEGALPAAHPLTYLIDDEEVILRTASGASSPPPSATTSSVSRPTRSTCTRAPGGASWASARPMRSSRRSGWPGSPHANRPPCSPTGPSTPSPSPDWPRRTPPPDAGGSGLRCGAAISAGGGAGPVAVRPIPLLSVGRPRPCVSSVALASKAGQRAGQGPFAPAQGRAAPMRS